MKNKEIPLDWFVCPMTKDELRREGNELVSKAGRYSLNTEFGYWNFIPSNSPTLKKPEWSTWQKLQDNGVVSYNEDPTKNLGVGKRNDFLQFRDFARMSGRLLDIGVGPQSIPSHVEHASAESTREFVGIDPLPGQQPKGYMFVQGLGEYLPFRRDFFDKTMFVTSLDHFIDPAIALTAAREVTKPNGEIIVWIGEKSKDAPRPATSPEWYLRLEVPEGAEDRFHYKRFTLKDFEQMTKKVELRVKEHEALQVDQWRTNHFYRLSK